MGNGDSQIAETGNVRSGRPEDADASPEQKLLRVLERERAARGTRGILSDEDSIAQQELSGGSGVAIKTHVVVDKQAGFAARVGPDGGVSVHELPKFDEQGEVIPPKVDGKPGGEERNSAQPPSDKPAPIEDSAGGFGLGNLFGSTIDTLGGFLEPVVGESNTTFAGVSLLIVGGFLVASWVAAPAGPPQGG